MMDRFYQVQNSLFLQFITTKTTAEVTTTTTTQLITEFGPIGQHVVGNAEQEFKHEHARATKLFNRMEHQNVIMFVSHEKPSGAMHKNALVSKY